MEEENDKFTLRDGRDVAVYEVLHDKPPLPFWSLVIHNPLNIFYYSFWSRRKGISHNIFSYPTSCFGMVKWSPSGTYFARTKLGYVVICKASGDLIPISVSYHPNKVFRVDFSPSGNYLATYYMWEEEVNLRILDVHNGTLLREFQGSDCGFRKGQELKSFINDALPLIMWSVGDKYMPLVEKTSLSIYACEALSSPPLTNISNVVDFCWSPVDPFIALLQSDGSDDGDILVSIMRFPEEEGVVETKKLESVSNLRICWQEEGKYAAFTYKTLGEDSKILIFKVEEHTCTSFDNRNSDILSFSFEPRGDRFAVIYGRKEDLWLEIVELKMINNSQVLKVQANAINWSPDGGLLMLSGHDNLLLYDANKRRVLLVCRRKTEAVQWSPSGRCVAGYVIDKKAVVIWHSSGQILDVRPIKANFYQLLWCPRFCSLVEQQPRTGYDYDLGREARLARASRSSPRYPSPSLVS